MQRTNKTLPLWRQLSRKKPIATSNNGIDALPRVLTTPSIVAIGISATVGTGIFFILGTAIPQAGPAVLISFIIAALTATLSALCYGELATLMPSAGSAYYYAYVTLGECTAAFVGSCLVLEYAVASAAVSVSWGNYLNQLLQYCHCPTIPAQLTASPWDPIHPGIMNLPAVILVFTCAALLCLGIKESARVNMTLVVIKISILTLFIIIAIHVFNGGNFIPFAPHGVAGITAGSAQIFFSFIGFNSITIASEEVKNPQKTIPRAIIICASIVLGLYLLIAIAALGAQPPTAFNPDQTLSDILYTITHSPVISAIFTIGTILSIFAVTLVTLYMQSRIFYAMSKDRLIPTRFSHLYTPKHSPIAAITITAAGVAFLAALVPLENLVEAVSVGTLIVFIIVDIGLIILRITRPELHREFRVPCYPWTPIISISACSIILWGITTTTWTIFIIWTAITMTFYLCWSRKNSQLHASTACANPTKS